MTVVAPYLLEDLLDLLEECKSEFQAMSMEPLAQLRGGGGGDQGVNPPPQDWQK